MSTNKKSDHPCSGVLTSVPIRDTYQDDAPIIFVLDFYNLSKRQLSLIQVDGPSDPNIGAGPIRRALAKRGFDPERFQTFLWDLT